MTTGAVQQERYAARGPARPGAPGRASGRLGPFRVGQIVVLELGILIVAVAFNGPVWLQAVAFTAVLVLLALPFGRRDGRWWYEHLALRQRFRKRRQQAAAAARTADPRRMALAALAPDLSVSEVVDRGTTFGVGQDSGGWFVVFDVGARTAAQEQRGSLVGLDRLAVMLTEMSVPVSGLQLVSHTVPAPARQLDPRVPAVQSYQELLAGAMVPASHHVWLAVRLDPSDGMRAAASRGGGIDGVRRALAASVGRITKAMQASFGGRPLNADELVAALSTVAGTPAGVGGRAGAGAVNGAVEEWTGWRDRSANHVCFELGGLPRRPLGELIGELIRTPALSFTLSVLLVEHGHHLAVRPLVRVSSTPEAFEGTARQVSEVLQRDGTTVRRLDGQHAPALYSTAPTGGGK
ncbi:MAG TPA: type VII secretion protein EccE [Micromonosporaceae bacterium]|nr:type VII secretion protein EccE [Micromonosporaceae bacterium]